MKLHFESDLPYQAAAIEAVCDLFRGQEVCRSVFTVTTQALNDSRQQSFEGKQFTAEGGIGNALQLIIDEELSENLQKVQLRNGLPPSDLLNARQLLNFTVEMETGTGKTYVYLRTVFELGFNRSMQHIKLCVSRRSVADEAKTQDLLHPNSEGNDVGTLEERRIPSADCPTVRP
jgi:restriction endonuclease